MRQILMASLVAGTLGAARPPVAQTRAWPERIWFRVRGGGQPTASSFPDGFGVPLYQEPEKVSIDYPGKGGALVAASGGYRVWRQLAIGVGLTRSSRRAQAAVDARLPHPFFDNQIRDVRGTTPATRGEVGAHLLVGWMQPPTVRFRALFTAGPPGRAVTRTRVTASKLPE